MLFYGFIHYIHSEIIFMNILTGCCDKPGKVKLSALIPSKPPPPPLTGYECSDKRYILPACRSKQTVKWDL